MVEDVQTSYWPRWGGSFRLGSSRTTMGLVKQRLDGLNHVEFERPDFRPTDLDRRIVEVRARHNIVAFRFGDNTAASTMNDRHPIAWSSWVGHDVMPLVVDRVRSPRTLAALDALGLRRRGRPAPARHDRAAARPGPSVAPELGGPGHHQHHVAQHRLIPDREGEPVPRDAPGAEHGRHALQPGPALRRTDQRGVQDDPGRELARLADLVAPLAPCIGVEPPWLAASLEAPSGALPARPASRRRASSS